MLKKRLLGRTGGEHETQTCQIWNQDWQEEVKQMPTLTVHRKGYRRKNGTWVKPATFKIMDRGAKGKGRKVIPKLKKGTLGVHFNEPMSTLKRKLKMKAQTLGEKRVAGKLRAISILNKRTNPKLSKKAGQLASWVSGSFKGKSYKGYPKGFGKNK